MNIGSNIEIVVTIIKNNRLLLKLGENGAVNLSKHSLDPREFFSAPVLVFPEGNDASYKRRVRDIIYHDGKMFINGKQPEVLQKKTKRIL